MVAEATELYPMSASTSANWSGKIRSLGMTGALLVLAGVGGAAALFLKKPPPSQAQGQTANDPAVSLWAAEILFGSQTVPPGNDLVERVVSAGTTRGIKMASAPWDSAQDVIKQHGPLPVLLTHQSLSPFILLDVFSWEDETLFLGTPANGGVAIFTEKEFRAAPWSHAVWAQETLPTAREVAVGQTKVSVDRVWHSFGAVNPYSVVKTEFQLTNPSDQPVRIERIGTSCGCATVPEITTRTLLPHSSLKLPVSLQTDSRRVIGQQVYILFSSGTDAEKKDSIPLTLDLYAWQPQCMEVSPSRIDFGPISRSRTAESVIRLTESPVDRFQLQGSEFAGLPIRDILEKSEREGLTTYLVRLRLDPSGLRTGEHSATIQINTSSRFRPVVKIPVHLTVASEIKARPAVVEFAPTSKEADLAPIAVTFHHQDKKPLRLSVLEAPDGIRAVVEKQESQTIVKMSVVPGRESKTGVVKLRVSWDGGEEVVEIPYYYFPAP